MRCCNSYLSSYQPITVPDSQPTLDKPNPVLHLSPQLATIFPKTPVDTGEIDGTAFLSSVLRFARCRWSPPPRLWRRDVLRDRPPALSRALVSSYLSWWTCCCCCFSGVAACEVGGFLGCVRLISGLCCPVGVGISIESCPDSNCLLILQLVPSGLYTHFTGVYFVP